LNKDLSDSQGNQLYEILEDDRKIPLSSIELEENAAEVDRILSDRTISENEEKCIRMKFLDQLSVAEISESLRISKKMVYTNVQRGLKKLRKKHNES
jgi:RNA polymerase sigma factor (sigma-70 family)